MNRGRWLGLVAALIFAGGDLKESRERVKTRHSADAFRPVRIGGDADETV